jgi:23S rRNA pseudouridine2605 synthase
LQERLQKIIAAAGIASRRKAEELILSGAVTVNGKAVTELGAKADAGEDHIKVNGRLINTLLERRELIYILLNKPIGYLTSTADPESRPLVIDLVGKYRDKVHPVGRLDFNSEGLLLLTNDGELTNLITSASRKVPKVYEVKVKGKPNAEQIDRLRRGVRIDDVRTYPAEIRQLPSTDANSWYAVTLYQGRNQQIRKMFDVIGHSVMKLRRVAIGTLNDEGLKPGHYRVLDASEVKRFFKRKNEKATRKRKV